LSIHSSHFPIFVAEQTKNAMKEINLNEENWKETLKQAEGDIKVIGKLTLKAEEQIAWYTEDHPDIIVDLTEMENFTDEEEWAVCLGYGHSGSVYGASGVKEVETSLRLFEEMWVDTVLLPEFVVRRHMNRLCDNGAVKKVVVSDSSQLFSMKDGDVWNKKGTKLVRKNN